MSNTQGRVFKRGLTYWISFYGPDQENKGRSKEYRVSTGIKVGNEKTPPRAAFQMLRDYTGRIWAGDFVPKADKVTFDDLVEGLKQDYRLNNRVSLDTAGRHLQHLRPFWSRVAPINYSIAMGKKYAELRLDEGAAVATVNREMACLNHMLKLAWENDQLPPMKKFKMLPGEKVREGFFEPGDFYKILDELESWRRNFIEWAYLTGWRSGKVKALEWRQVFLNNIPPVIRLDEGSITKKTPTELPLTGRLLEIIKEQEALREPSCPNVFHNRGHRIGNIRKAWYNACQRAGYLPKDHTKEQRENLLIHGFRRSMARNLSEAGVGAR
jgi:integrase